MEAIIRGFPLIFSWQLQLFTTVYKSAILKEQDPKASAITSPTATLEESRTLPRETFESKNVNQNFSLSNLKR